MKKQSLYFGLLFTLVCTLPLAAFQPGQPVRSVAVEWDGGKPQGTVEIHHGNLRDITIKEGKGKVQGNAFSFSSAGPCRIEITIVGADVNPGPGGTRVHMSTIRNPFTFFLRDIHRECPVFIPEFSAAVTEASDPRGYSEIAAGVGAKNLKTKLEKYQAEPEETWEDAAAHTRDQKVPTWLGLSRDIRIFQIEQSLGGSREMNTITPHLASSDVSLRQTGDRGITYGFMVGRGQGTAPDVERKLDRGTLPILHTILNDGDITYHSTAFASLEKSGLNAASISGTPFLVADYYCQGTTFTPAQEEAFGKALLHAIDHHNEVVLYFRCTAVNHSDVPRYAFFKAPRPGSGWWYHLPYHFSAGSGFSEFSHDSVFCISFLNGSPLPNEEVALLLQPGEKAEFTFFLPHMPIPESRAAGMTSGLFDDRLADCRTFWENKEQMAARIRLPEKRINEMLYAGLNHLDLITYGTEPEGTLAPSVGVYSPIGTESAPIIQYELSMGLFDRAERSIRYFLDKQHENGMIQNFGGYMIETGAVLWLMDEYFRYTADTTWAERVLPNLRKACRYLTDWRNSNTDPALKGHGYGMIAGKVADPEDEYHQFMLNGYAYLGMSRAAELARITDPVYADSLAAIAAQWKQDIRDAFFSARAGSPVVPLGDGRWTPTVPPWVEATSPAFLYTEPGTYFSHGTFFTRDGLLGPLHLVYTEVLDPHEQAARMMLDYYTELLFSRNAGFSQPYYHRHAWMELRDGMVKPFLKTYYNTFSGISDRETYDFWEHYYQVSPHKTHEEGWFLMQSRWMLYQEDGDTLNLMPGIPRRWLEDGDTVSLKHAASYFGPFDAEITSHLTEGYLRAVIDCGSARHPSAVKIRLPHPGGESPVNVSGGKYDPGTETLTIEPFTGHAEVMLEFER